LSICSLSTALFTFSNISLCSLLTYLELRQTTLNFASYITVKKPGKRASPTTKTPVRRSNREPHWILRESDYETLLCHEFLACRIVYYDDEESDPEGHVLHRNSYLCELKLSAVQWFLNTYVKSKKPGEPLIQISKYQAAKRLGIITTMLQTWTRNQDRIANQKKYSKQDRTAPQTGKEPIIEHTLYRKFEER
jgi:hypothetical protein